MRLVTKVLGLETIWNLITIIIIILVFGFESSTFLSATTGTHHTSVYMAMTHQHVKLGVKRFKTSDLKKYGTTVISEDSNHATLTIIIQSFTMTLHLVIIH